MPQTIIYTINHYNNLNITITILHQIDQLLKLGDDEVNEFSEISIFKLCFTRIIYEPHH